MRTLTESDDPAMVNEIKSHVAAIGAIVAEGTCPSLPMSTASLCGVLRNGTRILRVVKMTAKGARVVATSDDAATVTLWQTHAAEISDDEVA